MNCHGDMVDRAGLAKMANLPEGFKFFMWSREHEGGILMKGGVPRVITRGPRKGQNNWKGVPTRSVFVTESEIEEAGKSYEAETGLCCNCLGTKRVVCGWNRDTGNRYRECDRCSGTGTGAAAC